MNRTRTIGGGLFVVVAAVAAAQDIPDDVNRTVREATGVDLNAAIAAGGAAVDHDGSVDRRHPANQPHLVGSRFLDLETILPATGDVVGAIGTVVGERVGATGRELRLAIDFEALERLDPAQPESRLTLPLFDGASLELVFMHHERRGADRWSWIGKVAGVALSDAVLVREADAVHLVVHDYLTRRGVDVHWASPTEHVLVTYTAGDEPNERCSSGQDATAARPGDVAPVAPAGTAASVTVTDPANQVDIMFVATIEAAAAYGTENAFKAACQQVVDGFNLRSGNNGLDLTLRLVATYYSSGYNQSAAGQYGNNADGFLDLQRLAVAGDGHLDWVPAARDDVAADLVGLFRSNSWATSETFTSAGVAWAPATLTAMESEHPWNVNDGGYAFAVSTRTGDFVGTMTHEIGHTFGACHNVGADSEGGTCDTTITSSPHGFVDVCNVILQVNCHVTIMGYAPDDCDAAFYVPIWSSPSYVFDPGPLCPDVNMGNAVSNVANLIDVSRSTRGQSRIGAIVRWSQSGATDGNGTFHAPYATMSDSVSTVQGGLAEGVVRIKAGTFNETAGLGGTVTYGNPCTVTTVGGTVTIQ